MFCHHITSYSKSNQIKIKMIVPATLFLIFTQFYAPQQCYNNMTNPACITASNGNIDFTIHGIWPEFTNNSYPSFCNKSAIFNVSQISDIENQLNSVWLNYEGSNIEFWEHEYLKHATCYPNTTEHQFFQNGINLYNNVNTTKTFRDNFQYNTSIPKSNVNNILGGVAQCKKENNISYVDQYWRCYDLNLSSILCPDWLDDNCDEYISFHSW